MGINADQMLRRDSGERYLKPGFRERVMGRRVKDFIEISEYTSLDQLINTLTAIRDNLPAESDPELRMKGDDVFGRRLSISSRSGASESGWRS